MLNHYKKTKNTILKILKYKNTTILKIQIITQIQATQKCQKYKHQKTKQHKN